VIAVLRIFIINLLVIELIRPAVKRVHALFERKSSLVIDG
jgi:hypothetical protein